MQAWQSGEACPDILVVGARGSGQEDGDGGFASDSPTLGMGDEVYGFASTLAGDLADEGKTVAAWNNPYPAVPVSEALTGDTDIFESVLEGVATTRVILSIVARDCGTATRVVLAGYSQGAMVARDGAAFVAAEDRPLVAALVLIGDPEYDPDAEGARVGAPTNRSGVLGRSAPPAWIAPSTVHVCEAGDIICQFEGEGDLPERWDVIKAVLAHAGYVDPIIKSVTAAVVARLLRERCAGEVATLVGTDGDDHLVGTPDHDVIVGLGGDDVIEGAGGGDTICTGPVDGSEETATNTVDAGAGDDYVEGSGGRDLIQGAEGDDYLAGGAGNDRIDGGLGDDYLDAGSGDDELHGGGGLDYLDGGDGADALSAPDGAEYLDGGPGDDDLRAGAGYLDGGDGDDALTGGAASQYLDGGDGADRLTGGGGDDYLQGGAGADRLVGDDGFDYFDGGDDDDLLDARDNEPDQEFHCGAGTDEVRADPDRDSLALRVECEQAAQAIEFAAPGTHEYGDPPFAVAATSSSDRPTALEAVGACRLESGLVVLTGAGPCTLTASQAGDIDYAPAQPVARTFTIDRATLVVAANDASRPYGRENDPFDGTLSGVVNGDAVSAEYSSNASAQTKPGEYPIHASVVGDPAVLANYVLITHDGELTITDEHPPVIRVPGPITAEATGPNGATVAFAALVSATDDVLGDIIPSCAPASGATYAIGTTVVECTAQDGTNTTTERFDVVVRDTTAPSLLLPPTIRVVTTSAAGARVDYAVTSNDAVDGTRTPTCTPPSGALFPVGTTTVTCTTSDTRGNTASGSFSVVVSPMPAGDVASQLVAAVSASAAYRRLSSRDKARVDALVRTAATLIGQITNARSKTAAKALATAAVQALVGPGGLSQAEANEIKRLIALV